MPLEYRAVTSGQSLGDAATVEHVWTGNSLRPYRVTDLTVTQGEGNDYIFSFFQATKGPLVDAASGFAIDIYDQTGGTMYRSMGVFPGLAIATLLSLVTGGSGGETIVDKNTLYGSAVLDPWTTAAESTDQIVDTFSFVECEFADQGGASGAIELGVFAPGDGITTGNMKFGLRYVESSALLFVYVNGSPVASFDNSTNLYVGAGKRQSIRFSGSEVRFYVDYRYGKQPFYIAPGPSSFPYKIGATAGYLTAVKNINSSTARLQSIYSESQQIADFGALAGSFMARVYQNGRRPGWPKGNVSEIIVQSAGGHILLQTGDDLLLEGGAGFLLKE